MRPSFAPLFCNSLLCSTRTVVIRNLTLAFKCSVLRYLRPWFSVYSLYCTKYTVAYTSLGAI